MAKVALNNVSKVYPGRNGRDITAVNDMTLEVQDRESVVLVGPPGSGISSIIRMIAGLENISKGDISIDDRRINQLRPKERPIGMVPQNYEPYPYMSVYDNVALGLKLRKFPGAEIAKRVKAAAGIIGVEELLERKPAGLSIEQRQRVAIARAIALQPKVFLFDEPLAHLDAGARTQMRGEIAKLRQRLQTTMIYATQDPIDAMALGDRLVVIKDGAIEQEGTAHTLYHEPANVFVAGFFGRPSMNFIRGVLKQDRDWFLFSEVEEGTIELRLPVTELPAGRDYAGKEVLLGIRPENITIAESTGPGRYSGNFAAIIDLLEETGSEALLHLQTGAHGLVCRIHLDIKDLESGRRARFELRAEKILLFDPVSTRRIV